MLVQANGSSVKIADLSKPSNYSSAGPFFVLPQFLKGYTCKVIRVKCKKMKYVQYCTDFIFVQNLKSVQS